MKNAKPIKNDAMPDLPPREQQAVAAAYAKLMRKDQLSRSEEALIARFEKGREERLRWQYYCSIPKKHWRQMSGRQAKVINEQATRYGLPLGGPKVNLPELVKAFHDFLAKNAQKLAQEDDPLLRSAASSPALERYREERARLAELDRMERERELIPRVPMRMGMEVMCSFIRRASERLEDRYGIEAADIVREALDDYNVKLDEVFGDEPPDSDEFPGYEARGRLVMEDPT